MAGFCSRHQLYALKCPQCNAAPIVDAYKGKHRDDLKVLKSHFQWYVDLLRNFEHHAERIEERTGDVGAENLVRDLRTFRKLLEGTD